MKSSVGLILMVAVIVMTCSPFAAARREQASGLLAGVTFNPDNVKLSKSSGLDSVRVGGKVVDTAQGYMLVFAVGNDFMPDKELTLRFNLDPGTSPFGRTIECKPFAFGTEAYRLQHYKQGGEGSVGRGVLAVFTNCDKPAKGVSGNQHASDRIAATVRFDKKAGGKVNGWIQLELPGEYKTRLSGSFTAKLDGF